MVCSSGMEVESAWAARDLRSHSAGMLVYKLAGLPAGNWLLFHLRRLLIVSSVNGPATLCCYFNAQRNAVARGGEVLVMTSNTGFANDRHFRTVTRYQAYSFGFCMARFRAAREKATRYWGNSERVGQ